MRNPKPKYPSTYYSILCLFLSTLTIGFTLVYFIFYLDIELKLTNLSYIHQISSNALHSLIVFIICLFCANIIYEHAINLKRNQVLNYLKNILLSSVVITLISGFFSRDYYNNYRIDYYYTQLDTTIKSYNNNQPPRTQTYQEFLTDRQNRNIEKLKYYQNNITLLLDIIHKKI